MTRPSQAAGLTLISPRTKDGGERALSVDPIVGKDVLELLSSSMYVDPRAVYREYIQNSADAIDQAVECGLFAEGEMGRIDVRLDPATRTVTIRDNGIGVRADEAERVLTSLGASEKRGTAARGFRGVGRLAAFGYAQAVTFRTKAPGETVVSEVRWDCKKLKVALRDAAYRADVRQVIRDVVTVTTEQSAAKDDRFFEVKLEKAVRIKNDVLLNASEIESYLGEVAPAPFRSDFRQSQMVLKALAGHTKPCNFRIFVNDSKRHVTRPHRTDFPVSQTKVDQISDIQTETLRDSSGFVQGVLWIAHHGYQGALHASHEIRGLRARIGDIQIGDDQVFQAHFPEPRFNSWTIAELHITDPRIIPNGRRDGFEQSEAYEDLLSQIAPLMQQVGGRCRKASAIRNKVRGFDFRVVRVRQLFGELSQRSLSTRRQGILRSEITSAIVEMRKLAKASIIPEQQRINVRRRLAALEGEFGSLRLRRENAPPFDDFPKQERLLYQKVVDFLGELIPNRASASNLLDKLIARIEAEGLKGKRKSSRRKKKR